MTVLQLLLPGRAEVGNLTTDREPTLQAMADLYAYPEPVPARGWVRASMVSTLDGSAVGPDGLSGGLGGAVDRAAFTVMRGLCDVVVVGAGTVRAEGYGPPPVDPVFTERRRARGQRPAPALAVVTRSGDVPAANDLFEGSSPTFVVTTARADLTKLREEAGPDQVIVAGDADVDLDDAIRVLAARGFRRILLEGGPSLLGHTLAAGRVDELCLTWAPLMVAGPGPRIAVGPGADVTARPAHLLAAEDVLLGRWLVQHIPNR